MANVKYTKTVSDDHLKTVLQRISEFLKRDISVHSGDRGHVPQGGSRTSLHLKHRAADFHITGLSDAQAFKELKKAVKDGLAQLFDGKEGYEFIHHGPHTETEAEHLHLGHYDGKFQGFVVFKTEGLTKATAGEYTPDPVPIVKEAQTPNSPPPKTPAPPKTSSPKTPSPTKPSTGSPKGPSPKVANAHEVHLGGSVGIGGLNQSADVTKVQTLLNAARRAPVLSQTLGKYFEVLAEDGKCGDKTRAAIRLFQTHVVKMQNPDGRIDPDGRTLHMLLAWSESKPTQAPVVPSKPPVAPKPPVASKPKTKNTPKNTDPQPSHEVQEAILFASIDVGVDYGYMMAMAAQESGFNPAAKAGTSSAMGLYQFLSSTWLEMLNRYGIKEKYESCGLRQHAKKVIVVKDSKGKFVKYSVQGDKDDVLNLRLIPMYSALMGAEFARGNKRQLETALTKDPKTPYVVQPTDLYLAHFLGAGDAKHGATKFLLERRANGNRAAADLFSDAADANEYVFYKNKDRDKPRTLNEVYTLFEGKIGTRAESYNRTRPPAVC